MLKTIQSDSHVQNSLNFDHQKEVLQQNMVQQDKQRYPSSKKMNNLKNAYKDNNTIIETNEVKKNDGTRKLKDGSLTQKQLELEAVEDKAVEMMPEILQINDMANLID